jgi:hypothetical protein
MNDMFCSTTKQIFNKNVLISTICTQLELRTTNTTQLTLLLNLDYVFVAKAMIYFFKPISLSLSFKNSPAVVSVNCLGFAGVTQLSRQVKSMFERGCIKNGIE